MKSTRARGFTLIELLTVIAIIAILAALTFSTFPLIREMAKRRRVDNAFLQLRNAATLYYTDNGTYPPGYGFMSPEMRDYTPSQRDSLPDYTRYFLRPWMRYINFYGDPDMYDEFSETFSYDANRDGVLSISEYSPIAREDIVTERHEFPDQRFPEGGAALDSQVNEQMNTAPRPFIYAPVNLSQFKRLKRYWLQKGVESGGPDGFYGQFWDPSDPDFPTGIYDGYGGFVVPPSYDAFVLMSVGPAASTFGVLPSEPDWLNQIYSNYPEECYHIIALRAYFLATRDLNDNNELDFDYDARRSQGEAALEYDVNGVPVNNRLPSPVAPDGYGPYIFTHP
jgi:prepilin-type N-terminal cleavage/methylation domain-containing protein